jgi:hypothetical protein
MKKFLFLLIGCALLISNGRANDTLTRAQVYNFEVGDTFDYKYHNQSLPGSSWPFGYSYYYRIVITGKYVSSNNDTIAYQINNDSLVTYTHLDSIEAFAPILTTDTNCSFTFNFSQNFNNLPQNDRDEGCFEVGLDNSFVSGLGRTRMSISTTGGIESKVLIYYSKANSSWGNPYYLVDGSRFIHYLPLPEECATWTSEFNCSPQPCVAPPPIQIRTGHKLRANGRTWVELLYRRPTDQTFPTDSILGYFYNDTLNKLAVFCSDTNYSNVRVIYDANKVENNVCSWQGGYHIDSILINGIYRTRWTCWGQHACQDFGTNFISGIGDLTTLVPILSGCNGLPHLTCFSVCGETLYPLYSSTSCPLLMDIQENDVEDKRFRIYPNPANDVVSITLAGSLKLQLLSLTDITGQKLFEIKLTTGNTQLATESLPNGIYFVTVSAGEQSATQKLIIQK